MQPPGSVEGDGSYREPPSVNGRFKQYKETLPVPKDKLAKPLGQPRGSAFLTWTYLKQNQLM